MFLCKNLLSFEMNSVMQHGFVGLFMVQFTNNMNPQAHRK